jgi:cardiolipin synthase
MALDEEVNVVALDEALVKTLDEHFDDDLGRSVEIESGRWKERSPVQRTYERLSTPLRRFF